MIRSLNVALSSLSSSVVDQPSLDPQSTCCQELGGAAQVFRCSHSLLVVDSSCGHNWCLCSARWDSPGGCGGSSVPLLCNRTVQSQ